MYAKNCTSRDLINAAQAAGLLIDADWQPERKRFKFRLKRPHDNLKYAKYDPRPTDVEWVGLEPITAGWTERRAGRSVCFHGHYRFFFELFCIEPRTVVESHWYGKIVYNQFTFKTEAARLGMQRLGKPENIYHAFQVRETCHCDEAMLDYQESPY